MELGVPLLVRQEGNVLHKEQTSVRAARQGSHKQFTQARAAARRKTLLLLWWTDGGKGGGERSTLARQGCFGGSGDYARTGVWVI